MAATMDAGTGGGRQMTEDDLEQRCKKIDANLAQSEELIAELMARLKAGRGDNGAAQQPGLLGLLQRRHAELEERVAVLEKRCAQYHKWFEHIADKPLRDPEKTPVKTPAERREDPFDLLHAELAVGFKSVHEAIENARASIAGVSPRGKSE
jgi:hypothetical protein